MVDRTVKEGPAWLGEDVFVVSSDFKTGQNRIVTLVLRDEISGNNFYAKHVLHRGADPEEIKKLRNALKKNDFDRIGTAASSGLLGTGQSNINTSTVIDLNKVDPKLMVYRIAKALVLAYDAKKITPGARFDEVSVFFKVDESVITISKNNMTFKDDGVKIGGDFVAANGGNLRFDVDHCNGSDWT